MQLEKRSCSCNCNISMMTASHPPLGTHIPLVFRYNSGLVNPRSRHTLNSFSGTEWDSHDSVPLQLVCLINSGGRAASAEKVAGAAELAKYSTLLFGCGLPAACLPTPGSYSLPPLYSTVHSVVVGRVALEWAPGTASDPCTALKPFTAIKKIILKRVSRTPHPSIQPQKPGTSGRPPGGTLPV